MTTDPKHWILRDEHGCVLGAAVIHPHHLTEESAWESLAGDKRTPGMYLEKITSEQWDTEYRDRFGRCSGPSRPVGAVLAPVQGADPTGPQADADGEHTAIRDADGRFLGHRDRECGEHRTVGAHRAWCHDCGEWCYPADPCSQCALPVLRGLAAAERERADKAEAERDKIQAQHDAFAFRASNALVAEREAHKHTRRREEGYAKLAEAAINSLAQAMQAVPESSLPKSRWCHEVDGYSARLAELRAGTEEAQSNG